MSKTLASTVINFDGFYDSAKSPFKAVIEPGSPIVNEDFTVTIYAPEQYQLHSPYGGILSHSTKPALSLNEQASVKSPSTEYPMATLSAVIAANHLINTTSREIEIAAGSNLKDIITVSNSALKSEFDYLLGSAKVNYKTHPGQMWAHAGINYQGEIELYAQNLSTLEWQPISITISESSDSDSIKIESYPLRAFSTGFSGIYANFIVFPLSDDITIKTDVGRAVKFADTQHEIFRESITFSGKESSAAFYINSMTKFTGLFFDEFGNEITPNFSVSAGKLSASVECWGTGYLTYFSNGTIYDYYADVSTSTSGGITVKIGSAFAFDKKKKGIAASYEIPPSEAGKSNREDMIIIYRELIVQGSKTFEMPNGTPAWPDGNSYSGSPSAPTDDKPVIGDAYAVQQENKHIVFVEAGTFFDDIQASYWNYPYQTHTNPAQYIKWKVKSNIPTEETETIDASLINKLNQRLIELKAKYGIA